MRANRDLKYPPRVEDLNGEHLMYFEIPSVIAISLDGKFATITITSDCCLVGYERMLKCCITGESAILFEMLENDHDFNVSRRILALAECTDYSIFSIRDIKKF